MLSSVCGIRIGLNVKVAFEHLKTAPQSRNILGHDSDHIDRTRIEMMSQDRVVGICCFSGAGGQEIASRRNPSAVWKFSHSFEKLPGFTDVSVLTGPSEWASLDIGSSLGPMCNIGPGLELPLAWSGALALASESDGEPSRLARWLLACSPVRWSNSSEPST